jgi:glycosyltransferase involved in cell wall biosynthesis
MSSVAPPPIAYLLPSFPELAQTFVLGEIVELERLGVPLLIVSLRRPRAARQQREAATVRASVYYCPPGHAAEVWGATLRRIARAPWQTLRLVVAMAHGAWREGRSALSDPGVAGRLSLFERVRGWWHTGRFFSVLKTIALLPRAIHLAGVLDAAGVRRLHAHWASYPTTVALYLHRLTGIDFSFTAHAYDIYVAPSLLPEKIARARAVVTCAEANQRYLVEQLGEAVRDKIAVCYHGVDLTRFHPRAAGRTTRPPHLIACGQLEAYKGFEFLLHACALLRARGIEFTCRIVGEGPQRKRLESLCEELALRDCVQLPGVLTHDELIPEMAGAAVLVMPSIVLQGYGKRDVIPNVIVEAMALGVPVVATDVGGITEAVREGVSGTIVPPGDATALADTLATLLRDPARRARLGRGALQHARRHFDRRANTARLATLLDFVPATEAVSGELPLERVAP